MPAEANHRQGEGLPQGYFPPELDLILSSHKDIYAVYERYLNDGTELTLASDLLHLLRTESSPPPT